MTYFLTGGTGFIGRNLLARLLRRNGDIHVLVRAESLEKLGQIIDRLTNDFPDAGARIRPVIGDLTVPELGLSSDAVEELRRAKIKHLFHLGAIYDFNAPDEDNELINVEGTRATIELANELGVRCLHFVSTIAIAGFYDGVFREEDYDLGQELPLPYQRTKFAAEGLVRTNCERPWRIYRPSIVVGDSRSGEIDKVDGPYYLFPLLKRVSGLLPDWMPLLTPALGHANIVPVDFVADALDAIAATPGHDRETFHLVDPNPLRASEAAVALARAAGAAQLAEIRFAPNPITSVPLQAGARILSSPTARAVRRRLLHDFGIPEAVVDYSTSRTVFDATNATTVLQGTGISVPPFPSYAERLWEYWRHHFDPALDRPPHYVDAVSGKTVLITGASSGIGKATALKLARAGATVILAARGKEALAETRREIESEGGSARYYILDLTDPDSVDELIAAVKRDYPQLDIIINSAGHSIRRSVELSYDRFHDFERLIQVNYLGTIRLIMGFLPEMRERKSGHVINLSSIGVQTNPPRFSAYVASKSALDSWTRVVSAECLADNVHFTTIHLALVRTPMISPTKIYEIAPAMSADDAATLIAEAIRTRPKSVDTTLGTFGEVSYALFPSIVDRLMSTAYRVFPDSAAAKGVQATHERASPAQVLLSRVLKGIHW